MRRLPPWTLQITGVVLFFAQAVFWAVTDKASAIFVGPCLVLMLGGAVNDVLATIRSEIGEQGGNVTIEKKKHEPPEPRRPT